MSYARHGPSTCPLLPHPNPSRESFMSTEPDQPIDTLVLGDEYDDALRSALWRVLLEMDMELLDRTWGVGGSQEVETMRLRVAGELVTVESETYMGLSIAGPSGLVERIALAVRQVLGGGSPE